MAEAGRAHGLLNTFLRLNKSYKKATMNIISDSDGHMQVTITVTIVGQADQAPRRGGRQSNNKERGPGTQAPRPAPPSSPAPPAPATPTPAVTAPVSARRNRRRGPEALLRDERRRLGQIEPGILAHVIVDEVESGPPSLTTPSLPPRPPPWHAEGEKAPPPPHPRGPP